MHWKVCALQEEKPPQGEAQALQTEGTWTQHWRPEQPRINKYIKKEEIRMLSLKEIFNPGQPKPTNLTVFPLLKKVKVKVKSLSRVRLCDPMGCSLPGSSVHGILQARILEWVAISFPRGSSWPRDWTLVSLIVGRHLNLWASREGTFSC